MVCPQVWRAAAALSAPDVNSPPTGSPYARGTSTGGPLRSSFIAQPVDQLGGWKRRGIEVPLRGMTAHFLEQARLGLGLDPLGHHHQIQSPAHQDQGFGDGTPPCVLPDGGAETAIDLEDVERQFGQIAEGGKPGAEIVDGEMHPSCVRARMVCWAAE